MSTAKLGALEQWWGALLARFNYVMKYKPDRNNGNANAFRCPQRGSK